MKKHVWSTLLLVYLLTGQIGFSLQESETFIHCPPTGNGTGFSFITSYNSSGPIEITSNADFVAQATANGWSGNGSLEDPYVITDLNITSASHDDVLMSISDTRVHFSVEANLIVGGLIGIRLLNVTNGEISRNIVHSAMSNGLFMGLCNDCSVSENVMRDNGGLGILADYSEFCLFSGNIITDNAASGFHLRDSPNNTLSENVICNNTDIGLILGHSLDCTIDGNVVFNNSLRGISLEESGFTAVTGNTIYDHVGSGVKIEGGSVSGHISGNTFYRNDFTGLRILSGHFTVQENNFIDNGVSHSLFQQIVDGSDGSLFAYNFWSDWTGPDNNSDGIVDLPYTVPPIVEEHDQQDLTPRTSAYLNFDLHILTRPNVFFPDEHLDAEFYYGIMNLTWGQSSDTFGHSVSYSVYYSIDDCESWTQIVTGLTNTFYLWNTTVVPQDLEYQLKVICECSDELVSERIPDVAFTVREHTISTPTVIFPNGGEVFSYEIEARWTSSSDSWNHEILFRVYLSADEGASWVSVTDEISGDTAILDIAWLPDGSYILKVVADGSCGLAAEDESDASFTVRDINRLVLTIAGATAAGAIALITMFFVIRRRRSV
ncbi:MAG: right-handed parallel beta-helix repeat-containing protein [Candidatus Thorarchaeota archaeon]|nr:MAG: right-handed parallel beta-helix repeat-containing protein [Candidatus Thorarchaeota archaeon]